MVLVYFGFAVVAIILYVLFRPKSKNPFAQDERKSLPRISKASERDNILKCRFKESLVPSKPDAIVIGSGIGGLSTAAILAKTGKKVIVLEQHDQAGGCCHSFEQDKYEFDTGIHYIGEMKTPKTVLRFLMDQITCGYLQWAPLDDPFDIIVIKSPERDITIPVYASMRKYTEELVKIFPKEEAAIRKYMSLVRAVKRSTVAYVLVKVLPRRLVWVFVKTGLIHIFTNFFKFSSRSVSDVLDSLTNDQTLKCVLAYNFGDYGTRPGRGSFGIHAALMNHFFIDGGSYPVGGSAEIALGIIPVIRKAGGQVFVHARVQTILLDKGKAVGVELTAGSRIYAPIVISDAGVFNTFTSLLPVDTNLAPASLRYLAHSKRGMAGFSVFIGLNASHDELKLEGKRQHWIFSTTDLDAATKSLEDGKTSLENLTTNVPLVFISFPSLKDPTWNERSPGKTTCTLVTLLPFELFNMWDGTKSGKRGDEYNNMKLVIGKRMWEQALAALGLERLDKHVEYFEVGSPLTNQHYYNALKGEIYGIDHDVQRFSAEAAVDLRPETGIKGLYLTGQDVFSCGFAGALIGGVLCSSAVLKRNVWGDILHLKNGKWSLKMD